MVKNQPCPYLYCLFTVLNGGKGDITRRREKFRRSPISLNGSERSVCDFSSFHVRCRSRSGPFELHHFLKFLKSAQPLVPCQGQLLFSQLDDVGRGAVVVDDDNGTALQPGKGGVGRVVVEGAGVGRDLKRIVEGVFCGALSFPGCLPVDEIEIAVVVHDHAVKVPLYENINI